MAGQTLTVVGLTADNVEDVLAVSAFPEQLQYVIERQMRNHRATKRVEGDQSFQ